MHYPTLCIDNFYKDPDKVRNFALSLEYNKSSVGNYPGSRSNLIHEIDSNFVDIFSRKIFSLFHEQPPIRWEICTLFQKIYPYSEDCDDIINDGWIHVDSDGAIFAGVVYLNKNAASNCGTSIYKPSKKFDLDAANSNFNTRNKLYEKNSLHDIDIEKYREKKKHHESMFEKTIEISNCYNRLILYDANTWHKESSFCAKSSNEDFRLTQVFFIKGLEVNSTPFSRSNTFSL